MISKEVRYQKIQSGSTVLTKPSVQPVMSDMFCFVVVVLLVAFTVGREEAWMKRIERNYLAEMLVEFLFN